MNCLARVWRTIARVGLEPIVWLGGLVLICLLDPSSERHVIICPLALLGIDACPGCGLGRSIALLARGEFAASFQAHWLGIPAVAVLFGRSFSLGFRNLKRATIHHPHHL